MPELDRPTPASVESSTNAQSAPRAKPLVSRLSTTPAKSTALHLPRTLTVTENGVPRIRRLRLVDARGRLFNGRHHARSRSTGPGTRSTCPRSR